MAPWPSLWGGGLEGRLGVLVEALPDAHVEVWALRAFTSARGDVVADVAGCSAEVAAVGGYVDVVRRGVFCCAGFDENVGLTGI